MFGRTAYSPGFPSPAAHFSLEYVTGTRKDDTISSGLCQGPVHLDEMCLEQQEQHLCQ